MEAAIRASVQVGGPPPSNSGQQQQRGGSSQQTNDNGPSSQQLHHLHQQQTSSCNQQQQGSSTNSSAQHQHQQQQQQQQTNMSAYQQRISSGASPIHRPVETTQSYKKGGNLGSLSHHTAQQMHQPQIHHHQQQQHHHQQQQQQSSRSAASPLSPPRPGPGSAATASTYAKFGDVNAVREAPHRYIQQSSYSIGPGTQYRDSPHTRIPQIPPSQVQEYHRAAAVVAAASANNNTSSVVQVTTGLPPPPSGSINISGTHLDTLHFMHQTPAGPATTQLLGNSSSANSSNTGAPSPHNANSGASSIIVGRQRILLPAHGQAAQYPNEYLSSAAVAAVAAVNRQQLHQQQQQPQQQQQHTQQPQAPPDPGGQPYKKLRLSDSNVTNANHLPSPQIANVQQRQPSPAAISLSQTNSSRSSNSGHMQLSQPSHTHLTVLPAQPPLSVAVQQLKVETQPPQLQNASKPLVNRSTPTTVGGSFNSMQNTTVVSVTNSSTSSSSEAYHPQVEAISPTLPTDNAEERGRTTKEDLLMQIQKVDTDIQSAENTMEMLKKKETTLLETAAVCKQENEQEKKPEEDGVVDAANAWRSQTLAQKIYEANRKTAAAQHSILNNCGTRYMLPLYNQPLDVERLQTIMKRHQISVKDPLLEQVRKIKHERWLHNTGLVDRYTQMSADWQKRIEKAESSAKRKVREAKNREFFEKVFTELRKQREDKERFNRVGSRIKSEADLEEIMDGLQEQAMEDKKMRSYAVIPPLMYDLRQRRCVYHNENGFITDMIGVHKEQQMINVWTTGEKEIFKEKFLQHPKNFGAIAASLDRKSAQDCVRYYYLSKKAENYKQLLRKSRQRTRSSRNPQKTQQQQTQCIIDSLTTGVTTRLQREQQQKTGGRSAAAERERAAEKAAADAVKTAANIAIKAKSESNNEVLPKSAEGVDATKLEAGLLSVKSDENSTVLGSPITATSIETATTTTATTAAATTATDNGNSKGFNNSSDVNNSQSVTAGTKTNVEKVNAESSAINPTVNGTSVKVTTENAVTAVATTTNDKQKKESDTIATANGSDANANPVTVPTSDSTEKSIESTCSKDEKFATTASSITATPTTISTTTSPANTHPPAQLNTPNGIKSGYMVAIAAAAAAAVAVDEHKIGATTAAVADKSATATDVVPDEKSIVVTPTTSTTAGSFLGQKLKAAQVEGIGAGNECNSDVSDPKKKRLEMTDASPSSTLISSSSPVNNTGNILGKELNATTIGGATTNSIVSSAITVADETSKNPSPAATTASTTSTVTITITTTTTVASAATPATTTATEATSNNTIDSKDKLATCFVCKAEACPRTRPLKKGRGQQYGIADDSIVVGARVCNSCQCKSVRNRYPNCPIPTCPNPKDRAKRLHNIPARLFELASDIREPIMHEFQIPAQASRCCSACLMRIRRKLDPHINLTDEERRTTDGDESDVSTSSCDEREAGGSDTASVDSPENPQRHNALTKDLKKPLTPINANSVKTNVADTTTVTITVTKPDERLLPPLGHAPRKQKTSEEYDSSATETADEENENSPANRQSPKVTLNNSSSISGTGNTSVTPGLAPPSLNAQSNGPQPLPPTSQQIPLPGRESALNVQDFLYTMIEHSLKAKAQPPSKLPAQQHISSHISKSGVEQSSRRIDITNSVNNNNSSNNDVTIVREYRNDGSIVKQQAHGQSMSHNIQNLSSRQQNSSVSLSGSSTQAVQLPTENLATLSVVNSHIPGQHLPPHNMIHQHDVKATITPVVKSSKNSTPPHPPDTIIYGAPTSAQQHRNNEPEPQTLDLSIKKPSRDGPSPHSSSSVSSGLPEGLSRHQSPLSTVKHVSNMPSMYRGPEPTPLLGPNPTYLSYHPHPATVGKAPPGAFLVSQVPVPISMTQGRSQTSGVQQQPQPPQAQQTSQSSSAHMQLPSSATIGSKGPSKMAPKLSPQLIHHPTQHVPPPSQQQILVGGPKGSITHGTPVNNSQQIIVHTSSNALSPKFDNILRQTPPSTSDSKLGSITQGTPIHLPAHHLESKRAYEYYKPSQRQSPAQQPGPPPPPQQSSPQAPPPQNYGVNPAYVRSPYGVEQSPVLSTRQIVMHDYITSQQMQGQQRNVSRGSAGGGAGSDKESPSPRNSVNSIASGLVYYDKDRGRTEYSSRASPADHINSTPSPHRTPPPQRQGVIQRHNTGSKPPSPAASQQRSMHVMSHNYPPAGHEAFSSFVDVAVQQPQLPVPSQKDEKSTRHEQPTHPPHQHPSSQPPSRHEIRYQMNRDHMAMQIHQQAAAAAAAAVAAQQYHHHVAANAAAAVDLQRRMDQAKRDQRMHGIERDMQKRQERDMNRLHQERMQAERERIDRERERDRERVRERREQQRAADEQAREDRRLERIYAGNAAAAAAAVGTPHYLRVPPDSGPPRAIPDHERDPYHRIHPGQPTDGTLSAQVLIDAIIKHQISQGSSEPNPTNINRDMARSSIYNSRDIPLTRQHAPTAAALSAVENNGKSNSPSIINIDLDNDRMGSAQYDPPTSNSRGQIHNSRGPPSQQGPSPATSQSHSTQQQQPPIMTKGMTLGELTDSIITNDFGPNPIRPNMRPTANFMPYMQDPQTIVAPDRWKYHRMQQKEAEAAVAVNERGKNSIQNANNSGNIAGNNGGSGSRSNTPGDDRNTVPSPRKYVHEIMPHQTSGVVQHEAASHYYHPLGPPPTSVQSIGVHSRSSSGNPNLSSSGHDQRMSGGNTGSIPANATSVQNHHFDTMKYVQNRIVEVMRTEDDHRVEEIHHQHNDHRGGNKTLHETPVNISGSRKTPNQYDERDGRRSSSSTASNNDSQHAAPTTGLGPYQQQVPVTTFAPTTYAYPYSALNVPSSPVGLQPPPQMAMPHQPASHISKQQVHTHSTVESGGSGINNAQPSSSSSTAEPKPLLSAQYEALSDED